MADKRWLVALTALCVIVAFAGASMADEKRTLPDRGPLSGSRARPLLHEFNASSNGRLFGEMVGSESELKGNPPDSRSRVGISIERLSSTSGNHAQHDEYNASYDTCFSVERQFYLIVTDLSQRSDGGLLVCSHTSSSCSTVKECQQGAYGDTMIMKDLTNTPQTLIFKPKASPGYHVTWFVADDVNFTTGLQTYVGYVGECYYSNHLDPHSHAMYSLDKHMNVVLRAFNPDNCSGDPSKVKVARHNTVEFDGHTYFKVVAKPVSDTPRPLKYSIIFDTEDYPDIDAVGTVLYNKCQKDPLTGSYIWIYPVPNYNQMVYFYFDSSCSSESVRNMGGIPSAIPYSYSGTQVDLRQSKSNILLVKFHVSIYSYGYPSY